MSGARPRRSRQCSTVRLLNFLLLSRRSRASWHPSKKDNLPATHPPSPKTSALPRVPRGRTRRAAPRPGQASPAGSRLSGPAPRSRARSGFARDTKKPCISRRRRPIVRIGSLALIIHGGCFLCYDSDASQLAGLAAWICHDDGRSLNGRGLSASGAGRRRSVGPMRLNVLFRMEKYNAFRDQSQSL